MPGDLDYDLDTPFDAAAFDAPEDDFADLIDAEDDESHRGAFGDFGGTSGALIDRTFRERIIIVGVTLGGGDPERTESDLDELALLVDTAGADVVGRILQRRSAPDPGHLHRQGQGRRAQGPVGRARLRHRGVRRRPEPGPAAQPGEAARAAPPSTAPP